MVAKFTEAQVSVVEALADTVVAPLTEQEEVALTSDGHPATVPTDDIASFAKFSGASQVPIILKRLQGLREDKLAGIKHILDLLSTAEGTQILAGKSKAFPTLSREEREAVLLGWKASPFPGELGLYKSLTSVILNTIYRSANCPAYAAMKYDGIDVARSAADYKPANPTERLPMLTPEELAQIPSFDTIIVGSGAGGGVVAAELAAAGQSVLVIEKGRYYHESEFVLTEEQGATLLDNGDPLISENGNVQMLYASVFGGGTTINWSASLKPNHVVREKWAKDFGLPHFLSPQFAADLDRVYQRIGATSSGIKHNKPNQFVIDGCNKTGFTVADVPQNTSGRSHECNHCYYGCKDGVKNGTMNTWLRDAYAHGAKFLDRTRVNCVVVENGKATGVEVFVHGSENKTIVSASRVVISGGTMRTPGILLNSGLTNKHIGRNLRIHPCSFVFGVFDEPVNMDYGSILTTVAMVADDVRLEVPNVHAGALYGILPWSGALKHKQQALKYKYFSPFIILPSEKESTGYVSTNDKGEVSFDYNLVQSDRDRIIEAIDNTVQIACAAGAREIYTIQIGVDPFVFAKDEEIRPDHPRFVKWRQQIRQYGLPDTGVSTILSAHPQGTCRLGVSPEVGATKTTGETWEVENLYVADASLFPTSTGVNPMVTTEAVALYVASNIIKASK
ncbi:GMC oxidoreductase-domain-containing protein [Fennellomyces sp. T-0311]|nr:GMC oxidoreductase-domain-containing protein [Fennellomyces sp. T-0311]